MISPSFDIYQFIEKIKEKNADDMVDMAEQEAVQTWKRTYKQSGSLSDEQKSGMRYENILLKIIDLIRYGIMHRDLSEIDHELLKSIR